MVPVANYRRAGMTLIELLVVVAILGLLAVTVLPTLATTADARRTREATRIVSSYIAKAQSRAIGRIEWAGFWMAPPASNTSANFALDLYLADVPAVFRGDSIPTTISGSATAGTFTITTGSLNGTTVSGSVGDLVRFDGCPPWYAFQTATSVRLRDGGGSSEDAGQSSLNTPWPAPGTAHTFELLRQPIRAGSPLSIADGRCIDLRWSGFGGWNASTYSTFGASPGSIAILFDGTGRLRQLFNAGTRVTISGPVFLLVGRSDRAGNNAADLTAADDSVGANWQYSDSYWIAIDPLSGVAKTAECAKQAGRISDDVFVSQSFIRSEVVAGGR
jgi:prepilin-type N-terminal cleavage/methylation domain-containing protein